MKITLMTWMVYFPVQDDILLAKSVLLDMLDEFSATTLNTEAKPPPPSVPKPKAPPIEQPDAFSDDDFAKQLQAGMADLIGEFDKSVST